MHAFSSKKITINLIKYPNRESLYHDLADDIVKDLAILLEQQRRVSLSVPGGTTPKPLFKKLRSADIDWFRVHVVCTDERWVDEADKRSNARLIRENLLTNNAERATFLSYCHNINDLEENLATIRKRIKMILPLSIAVLGMGTDGHVASLFPDAPELSDALDEDAPVLVVTRPPSQPETRLSLSAQTINDATIKHLVITGGDKLEVMCQAIRSYKHNLPVQRILNGTVVHWAP